MWEKWANQKKQFSQSFTNWGLLCKNTWKSCNITKSEYPCRIFGRFFFVTAYSIVCNFQIIPKIQLYHMNDFCLNFYFFAQFLKELKNIEKSAKLTRRSGKLLTTKGKKICFSLFVYFYTTESFKTNLLLPHYTLHFMVVSGCLAVCLPIYQSHFVFINASFLSIYKFMLLYLVCLSCLPLCSLFLSLVINCFSVFKENPHFWPHLGPSVFQSFTNGSSSHIILDFCFSVNNFLFFLLFLYFPFLFFLSFFLYTIQFF